MNSSEVTGLVRGNTDFPDPGCLLCSSLQRVHVEGWLKVFVWMDGPGVLETSSQGFKNCLVCALRSEGHLRAAPLAQASCNSNSLLRRQSGGDIMTSECLAKSGREV